MRRAAHRRGERIGLVEISGAFVGKGPDSWAGSTVHGGKVSAHWRTAGVRPIGAEAAPGQGDALRLRRVRLALANLHAGFAALALPRFPFIR